MYSVTVRIEDLCIFRWGAPLTKCWNRGAFFGFGTSNTASCLRTDTIQACTYICNNEARSCNQCCSRKAISITYSVCAFVAFRYPTCNAHVPRFHLWPVRLLQYFSTSSHKRNHIRGSCWAQNVCFDILYNFVWNISHSKDNSLLPLVVICVL